MPSTRLCSWLCASFVFPCLFGCSDAGGGLPEWSTDSVALGVPDASDSDAPLVPAPVTPALPLLGGTLLVTASGQFAIASSPERDAVHVVPLEGMEVAQTISLGEGSVPVRLVEDDQSTIHVLERGSGEVTSFDPSEPGSLLVRPVCSDPRGIAYDAHAGELVVTCQSGEMVWFSPTGVEPLRRRFVALDLRDVVALGDELIVSTFRMAGLLHVSREGEVVRRLRPATVSVDGSGVFEPHVAGRMLLTSGGRVVMQHQRSNVSAVSSAYYSASGCDRSLSHNALTISDVYGEELRSVGILPPGVATDVAVTPDGTEFAILTTAPGETGIHYGRLDVPADAPCRPIELTSIRISGTAVAVAFAADGRLVVQRRETETLEIVGGAAAVLGPGIPASPTFDLFHQPTPQGIACATCHPEGGDDGTTWSFGFEGLRRTQVVARRIRATAPLHWQGGFVGMKDLLSDTLVNRMGGSLPGDETIAQLEEFIDRLPFAVPPRGVEDADAILGKDLFQSLHCGDCHSGDYYTDNKSYDVGTGGYFQTPSLLGVAYRVPLMHDGCARTLTQRFGSCGGDVRHGDVAVLSADEIGQLVAFLETL